MVVWKVPAGEKPLRESLVTFRKRAETLSDDLRHMTHQLHPTVLEHLGLISALRSYFAEFSWHERIRVWFTTGQISGPPSEVSICLYRIVQEALGNVARHLGAKEAWVRSMQEKEVIQLSITDKGVGIYPDAVRDMPGLRPIRIRERVQLVNGQLDISAPGGVRELQVACRWNGRKKQSDFEDQLKETHGITGGRSCHRT
jgi:signal transduction histidine kinase